MQTVTISILKGFEALKNVPDEQLQWLIDNSRERFLQDGEQLTTPGQRIAGAAFYY